MKFRHLPVTSELDATHNFEQLQGLVTELEGGSGGGGVFTNTQIAIAYRNAAQEIPGTGTYTKIELDKTIYDPNGLITGGAYKVAVEGVYQVDGQAQLVNSEAKEILNVAIFVNAVEKIGGTFLPPNTEEAATYGGTVSGLVKCKAGDTIELFAKKNGKKKPLSISETFNRLSVFRVPPEVAEVAGVAGGDLTGTYPNPTIGTEKVTEAKLAAALKTGAWTNPESFNAKLEATGTCQVRIEQNSAVARLKGTVKAKEEITTFKALFTLPVGFRPSAVARCWASDATKGTVMLVNIQTTGVVESSTALPAADVMAFDGITFNLT